VTQEIAPPPNMRDGMLDMEDEIAMAPQPQSMWLNGLAKVPVLATVSRSDMFRDAASLPRGPLRYCLIYKTRAGVCFSQ
jgi:hypothetical protein